MMGSSAVSPRLSSALFAWINLRFPSQDYNFKLSNFSLAADLEPKNITV